MEVGTYVEDGDDDDDDDDDDGWLTVSIMHAHITYAGWTIELIFNKINFE